MYNLYNIKYENKRKCVSKDLRKDIYIYIQIQGQIDGKRKSERVYVRTYSMYVCMSRLCILQLQPRAINNKLYRRKSAQLK